MAMTADKIKDLKSMITKAKTGPVNIGICFGKKAAGVEIIMDKIRKPETLGREAKAAGETVKVAVGTFEVSGTKATFRCEGDAPTGLGKHLKKFFALNDITVMAVEIIGADGKVIAEQDEKGDGEDAGLAQTAGVTGTAATEGNATQARQDDASQQDKAQQDTAQQDKAPQDTAPQDTAPQDTAPQDTAQPGPAQVAWAAAWASAEPKVALAIAKDDALAAKVTKLRDFLLAKVTASDFEAAGKGLPSLMALLGAQATGQQAEQSINPQTTEQTAETAAEQTTETAAKPLDPNDLVRRLGVIKPKLVGLPDALGERLNGMFQTAVEQVKTGVLVPAATGIAQLEAALAKISATRQDTNAASQTGETTPDPKLAGLSQAVEALRAQVTASTAGDGRDAMFAVLDTVAGQITAREAEKAMAGLKRVQDGLKLQAEVDRLGPIVAKAASGGRVADVNALNNLFNMVAESVPATDHAKAMANLARVEAMIAEGAAKETSTFEDEVPPDVKPFATARLNWMFTRRSLKDELSKLEAAIAKALDNAGLGGDIKVDGALMSYIDDLDTRLENKLSEIVSADTEADREKLKGEARDLIDDYNDVLERDFFKDVDNSNGFMAVSVTATAQTMLKDLSGVLA